MTTQTRGPAVSETGDTRDRLNLTLSPSMAAALDQVAETLGVPKSTLAVQALAEVLPSWLERAQAVSRVARTAGSKPRR